MAKGKKTCKILKEIRRQIAEANDIEYVVDECQYKGDCLGTCPKCEAEVRYLEQQLHQRQLLGKAVVLAGVSVGMFTLSSCDSKDKTREIELAALQEQKKEPKIERTPYNSTTGMVDSEDAYIGGKRRVKFTPPVIKGDVEVLPETTPKENLSKKENVDEAKNDNCDNCKQDENGVYDSVEEMPTYPGGMAALMAFLQKNLKYPKVDEELGVQGRIIWTMIINEDGSCSDVKDVKPVHPLFEAEIIRLVEAMPKWNPGKHNGKPVKVKYTLPISINLQ